jgi:hypothetical protein
MTHAIVAALIVLTLLAGVSAAEPISAGIWTPTPLADNDGVGFYDRPSWDCSTCNIGFQLRDPRLEYLHDGAHGAVPFVYRHFEGAGLIGRSTAWTDGFLSWDAVTHAFIYDTGTGYVLSSWQGTNMVLFRLVGTAAITYWLGVEDIPVGFGVEDRDFNDSIYQWSAVPALPPPPPPPPPPPVPEPATWTLALAGIATALGWRSRAARHRARSQGLERSDTRNG